MDATLDVSRNRVFGPSPVFERSGIELELARRRGKPDARLAIDLHTDRRALGIDHLRLWIDCCAFQIFRGHRLFVASVRALLYKERAVLAHVVERRQALFCGSFGKAKHAVFKNPAIVFGDRQLLTSAIRRLEVLPDSQRAVGIDAPGQLDPELIFFPDLAQAGLAVSFVRGIELLALLLE